MGYKEKPDPATLKVTGNSALSAGLARRQPTFLRRNWLAILDIHERRLSTMSGSSSHNEGGSTKQLSTVRGLQSDQLKRWNGTGKNVLRNFIEVQHEYQHRPPQIEITRLVIKHRNALAAVQVATPAATPASDSDWLEDKNKVDCTGIVSGTNGLVRTQPFQGHLALVDKQMVLELNQPLLIDVLRHNKESANLSSELAQTANGVQALDPEDVLGIRIRLFTTKCALTSLAIAPDTMPVQSTDRSDAREMEALARYGSQAIVFDTFTALTLSCPTPESLSARLNYSALEIELSCSWTTDTASHLETFNRLTTKRRRTEQRAHTTRICEVIYLFQDKTQINIKNLTCPLCSTPYDYKQFKVLHLHLLNHHDHFSFVVKEKENGIMLVQLDLAEKKIFKNNIQPDDKEFDRIAPQQPFDLEKHLSGEDRSWTEGQREQSSRPLRPKSRNNKSRRPNTAQVVLPVEQLYKRLPPDQVKELQPRVKIKHAVPAVLDVNGAQVSFFRTNSKRPFAVGEEIENSDDEVDDSWIPERRRQTLEKMIGLKLSRGAAKFRADWDTHIDFEELHGISGDLLKRDGAIRFARKCGDKLADDDYYQEWLAKVQRLHKWNVFDMDDVDYCFDLAREARRAARARAAAADPPPSAEKEHVSVAKDNTGSPARAPSTPARMQSAERNARHLANSSARRRQLFDGAGQRYETEVV